MRKTKCLPSVARLDNSLKLLLFRDQQLFFVSLFVYPPVSASVYFLYIYFLYTRRYVRDLAVCLCAARQIVSSLRDDVDDCIQKQIILFAYAVALSFEL